MAVQVRVPLELASARAVEPPCAQVPKAAVQVHVLLELELALALAQNRERFDWPVPLASARAGQGAP